jgi:hypothetical protein
MSEAVLVAAMLWVLAVGVLGLYFHRRLRRTGQQRRLVRHFKETLRSPDTERKQRE